MASEGGEQQGGGAADFFGAGADGGEQQQQQQGGDEQQGGGAAGGGDTGGFVAPDWFEKLSADTGEGETSSNRDYAQAKGFKDLDGVFKSLRNAERAIHDKGRVAVPGEGAKPEEVAAFRAAIGVPDKIDGYEVKAPEGVQLNEPLIGALRESALKHGAPKGVFEGLVSDFIQMQREEADATNTKQLTEAKDWLKAQGAKADEQKAHIDTAGRALGLTSDDMVFFRSMPGGAGRALDMLSKLGAGMAEDTMMNGGKGRFGITSAEAQVEIDKIKNDPELSKKVLIPGSAENARWKRLNQQAAEGKAAAQQKL